MSRPDDLGRRDANEREIIDALQALGCKVRQIGPAGPLDLVVGFRGRTTHLEVKDGRKPPSDRQLTEREKAFLSGWTGGRAGVVLDVDEAIDFVVGGAR